MDGSKKQQRQKLNMKRKYVAVFPSAGHIRRGGRWVKTSTNGDENGAEDEEGAREESALEGEEDSY